MNGNPPAASTPSGKAAVTVVTLDGLLDPAGVPLPLGNDDEHAVIVLPPRCCNHHASRAVPGNSTKEGYATANLLFDTAEHMITVAGLKLKIPGMELDALKAQLPLTSGLQLTYGQLIALGGDFYGDPDKPVCLQQSLAAQIEQFKRNFELLRSSADEIAKILKITEAYEFRPIAERVAQDLPPSGAYQSIPRTQGPTMNDEDQAFDQATGGGGPGTTTFGRYTGLAITNFDHFGEDAVTCYTAGHILAQRVAIEAGTSQDVAKLKLAYAINAFADHFLTDLFAAGHIRTPRRKLYESASNQLTQYLAGYCAKCMHDEDNKFGLWVTNKLGDKWVAYGDARYRDSLNAANRVVMKAALQRSMDNVWEAYEERSEVTPSKVLDYLPTPAGGVTGDQNWTPLFLWNHANNILDRRRELGDVSDSEFEPQTWSGWGLTTTAIGLRNRGVPYLPKTQYKTANLPFPPDESGSTGEIGWPRKPENVVGPERVKKDLRGLPSSLKPEDWRIDGTAKPD